MHGERDDDEPVATNYQVIKVKMAERKHHRYLGDGVYASFDGHHVWLHVGSHENPPVVALEPKVLFALVKYQDEMLTALKDVGWKEPA
jgi:hypothetical protein